ncbi:uncharacterized protein LOC106664972 [Cimex lectularius]|uniref:Uncharacterized protein n=1 Tax=Cimex lectularius TaxID=79782 RepID=A0A8I6RNB7_CIMLE|nr:uncharacterized protein LOC106664972 [Cimex lectularius]
MVVLPKLHSCSLIDFDLNNPSHSFILYKWCLSLSRRLPIFERSAYRKALTWKLGRAWAQLALAIGPEDAKLILSECEKLGNIPPGNWASYIDNVNSVRQGRQVQMESVDTSFITTFLTILGVIIICLAIYSLLWRMKPLKNTEMN